MAGDIWFNNDGTVVKVIVGTNIMLMEYPSECIDDWGITCAELSQSIQDHWKEELGQDAIIECDPDAEGCDCMVVVAQLDITSSTWEVSSTDPYVINHGTPGNPTDRFCQSGDHMEIEFHGDPNIPDTTLTLVREDN